MSASLTRQGQLLDEKEKFTKRLKLIAKELDTEDLLATNATINPKDQQSIEYYETEMRGHTSKLFDAKDKARNDKKSKIEKVEAAMGALKADMASREEKHRQATERHQSVMEKLENEMKQLEKKVDTMTNDIETSADRLQVEHDNYMRYCQQMIESKKVKASNPRAIKMRAEKEIIEKEIERLDKMYDDEAAAHREYLRGQIAAMRAKEKENPWAC